MKRTILVATLLVGSSICTQSFGFDLLDRMLGLKGSGCDSVCCDTGVCDNGGYGCAVDPACGCEAPCGGACGEASCGFENACGGACGGACGEASCGFESACGGACGEPACGFESGCCGKGHRGLLHKLFGHHHRSSCDAGCGCAAEPACGCEAPCGDYGCADPACGCEVAGPCGCDTACCGSKRPHLLARLFGGHHGCDSGCDAGYCDSMPSCGCSTGAVSAPVAAPPVQIQDAAPMPPAPMVDPSAYLNSKRRVIQASARYVR